MYIETALVLQLITEGIHIYLLLNNQIRKIRINLVTASQCNFFNNFNFQMLYRCIMIGNKNFT